MSWTGNGATRSACEKGRYSYAGVTYFHAKFESTTSTTLYLFQQPGQQLIKD